MENEQPKNLIALLVSSLNEEANDDQVLSGLTRAEIFDEVLMMIMTGYETTSTALSWFIFFASKNPQIQQRMKEELRKHHLLMIDNLKYVPPLTVDNLTSLTYCECVTKEVLRLGPVFGLTSRIATYDTIVDDVKIHRGQTILIALHNINTDARFLGEDKNHHPLAMIPFGGGHRACIGQELAWLELKTIIVRMMQRDITFEDTPENVGVQFNGGCISPTNVDNPNDLEPDQEEKIFHCFSNVKIFHVPQTADRARTLFEQLSKFKLFPVITATLQMVCHDAQNGFYTSSIRMNQPHIIDLKLHYSDEFEIIHEQLLEILQEKDSTGITFLHGPPGTGKTYYLRYLINEIKEKSLIYVPPDLVNDMTKPGFLPFLMQHPNSILIIEDAENIIRDRIQESFLPNQAVANLLNLSDGLLGDAMHQQIICTFNCDVKGIDPALLRDGRLVIEHKFDKLSVQNARRMCVELGIFGNGEDIHEPISLAEIYARKNGAVAYLANGLGNGHTTTMKNKRPLKKRNQKADPFLGFYS
ncbi:unnamed protein product [Rotaria sordida]|uniref:AAA+ ATPase domain-containing protein n=1 Tax=Rotaria sordida TaxID=392033 RepID=A0A815BNS3_9BILA|nr:unnamed protein product [Rotaria sordida]